MTDIVLIAHDIRSTHNIGSLLRTAEGLGVHKVYFSGYTPYPAHANDERLPHMAGKISRQIAKTALGAEELVEWECVDDVVALLHRLQEEGYTVCALEQCDASLPLPQFKVPRKVAILLGREVEGIDAELLALCDKTLEIPMFGKKESFNVVQAAAMVLYHCRFSEN